MQNKTKFWLMNNRYKNVFKLFISENLHLVACEDADPGKHCEENLSLFHCNL